MTSSLPNAISILLVVIIIILSVIIFGFQKGVDCSKPESLYEQRFKMDTGYQTSAKYIGKMAKLDACLEQHEYSKKLEKNSATQEDMLLLQQKNHINILIKDLEIKATSYAFINKVFFWLSLFFAICIIGIPIATSVIKQDSIMHKIFSPTQLPAITLLAGLCFTFYSDYKGKQTSAENLMRYTFFSTDSVKKISKTVREGLSEIDNGQDFSNIIKDGG